MRTDLWCAEDEAILRCLYPDIGAKGVQPLLSRHRALNAIMDKAAKMQVHRIGRTDSQPRQETVNWVNGRRAELERLAELDLSAAAIAERMGVTKNSVIGALSRNDDIYWPGRRNCVVVTTLYNRLPEIDTDSCRWLDGEPREFRYCGKPVARKADSGHGESYCAEHRAIVWGAVPQGRKPDLPGRAKW